MMRGWHMDWTRLRVGIIGCCLGVMLLPSLGTAQLFKRRERDPDDRPRENVANRANTPAALPSPTGGTPAAPKTNSSGFQNTAAPPTTVDYEVPDTTDVSVLVKYLSTLLTFQPSTKEAAEAYRQRAPQAMAIAASRILEYETDTNSDSYLFAEKYLLACDVMSVDQATPDEKEALLDLIVRNLQRPSMDADDLDIAVAFTEGLEMSGDKQAAANAYRRFADVFRASQDPMIVELGQLMEGSARRLNLVGNTLSVEGTTLDGKTFNWNSYRGKVVLVDFWATWCGPCVKEFPNLKKVYELYHDRGFEIVGICMNEQREHVDQFFQANELPWVTLWEPNGKTNATAIYYGISVLPTTILVDQQGRVVTLSARGEALTQQLARLLGPAN